MTGVPLVKGQILLGERNHAAQPFFQPFRRTLRSYADNPLSGCLKFICRHDLSGSQYRLQYGFKNMNKLRSGKKHCGECFFLDMSITDLIYKTDACENMNKLRSGRPWLRREDEK
jgi:hypothetical protein